MDLRITPLEERIVLDAAGAVDADGTQDNLEQHEAESGSLWTEAAVDDGALVLDAAADDSATDAAGGEGVHVLAVSDSVTNAEDLAAAALDNVLTVLFDGDSSTPETILDAIGDALDGEEADSIALATNARGEGGLALSDDVTVNGESLFADSRLTAFWEGLGALLSEDGRIDLLACDLTSTEAGLDLVSDLEAVTGHDVAASKDMTGNVWDGDWELETGNVDLAEVYFAWDALEQYEGRLDPKFWYVDATSPYGLSTPGVGTTWNLAFSNLNDLLTINEDQPNTVVDGDTIRVAGGTYRPAGPFDADRQLISFQMIAGVDMYGGYAGRGNRNPNARNEVSILHGDIDANDYNGVDNFEDSVAAGLRNDNARHVLVGANNCTLDGFTIRGGFAHTAGGTIDTANFGGGMVNSGVTDLRLNDIVFTDNYAVYGGGMANKATTVLVENSWFHNNYAGGVTGPAPDSIVDPGYGGAVYTDGDPDKENVVTFRLTAFGAQGLDDEIDIDYDHGNIATNGGGAIYTVQESVTFMDCYFGGNEVTAGHGGAIYNGGGGSAVIRAVQTYDATTILEYNTATGSGGAIYHNGDRTYGVEMTFRNNTADGIDPATGDPTGGGGAVYSVGAGGDGANMHLVYAFFQNNQTTSGSGGALYLAGGTMRLTSSTIVNNTAALDGGGAYYSGGTSHHMNVIFAVNNVGDQGGGVTVAGGTQNIINTTFHRNQTSAVHVEGGWANIQNSILWGNGGAEVTGGWANIDYSLVKGGYLGGTAIIDSDPLFYGDLIDAIPGNGIVEDLDGPDNTWNTFDDGLRLGIREETISPAVDAGDMSQLDWDYSDVDKDGIRDPHTEGEEFIEGEIIPFDIMRELRVRRGVVDLGAHEKLFLLFVDKDQTLQPEDGYQWTTAYNELWEGMQEAQRVAGLFDEIWVAGFEFGQDTPFVYEPTDEEDRTASFDMVDGLMLYGGWEGTHTDRRLHIANKEWDTYVTVLSGDLAGDDTGGQGNRDDNAYHVVTVQGDGLSVVDPLDATNDPADAADSHVNALAVRSSDGKVILAGQHDGVGVLVRLHKDGTVDESFGNAAAVIDGFGNDYDADGLPDGYVIMAVASGTNIGDPALTEDELEIAFNQNLGENSFTGVNLSVNPDIAYLGKRWNGGTRSIGRVVVHASADEGFDREDGQVRIRFEGSLDGQEWTEIGVRSVDDTALSGPIEVTPSASSPPYFYHRVVLETDSATNVLDENATTDLYVSEVTFYDGTTDLAVDPATGFTISNMVNAGAAFDSNTAQAAVASSTLDFNRYLELGQDWSTGPIGEVVVASATVYPASDLGFFTSEDNSNPYVHLHLQGYDATSEAWVALGSETYVGGDETTPVSIEASSWLSATPYSKHRVVVEPYSWNDLVSGTFYAAEVQFTLAGEQMINPAALAFDSEGNVVVGGSLRTAVGRDSMALLLRYDENGALDQSFGQDGFNTYDFDLGGTNDECITALDISDTGRITVAGWVDNTDGTGGQDIFAMRYGSTGLADSTWNGGEPTVIDFGGTADVVNDVLVHGDLYTYLAGTDGADFVVASLGSTGALNTAFDTDGLVHLDVGGAADEAHTLELQSDGLLLVGGTNGAQAALARMDSTGTLDTEFDDDGILLTSVNAAIDNDDVENPLGNFAGGDADELTRVFDNDVVEASSETVTYTGTNAEIGSDWGGGVNRTLAAVVLTGSSDLGFDASSGDSTITFELQGSDDALFWTTVGSEVEADSAGRRVVVSASDTSRGYEYHRVRIKSTEGSTTFYLAETEFVEVVDTAVAYDITLSTNADGQNVIRVGAAGANSVGSAFSQHGAILQFFSDGLPDTSFDEYNSGQRSSLYAGDIINGGALDHAEKLYLYGSALGMVNLDFAVGRFNSGGGTDTTWDEKDIRNAGLDGFIVRGGNAVVKEGSPIFDGDETVQMGGGIYINHAEGFVLRHMTITDNIATIGGGLHVQDGSPHMMEWIESPEYDRVSPFSYPTWYYEQGAEYGDTWILPNVAVGSSRFEANYATRWGGGVSAPSGSFYAASTYFVGNDGGGWGGALTNYSDEDGWLRLESCALVGNLAEAGGAIELFGTSYGSAMDLVNCTVVGNKALLIHEADGDPEYRGGAFYLHEEEANATIVNSILWDNVVVDEEGIEHVNHFNYRLDTDLDTGEVMYREGSVFLTEWHNFPPDNESDGWYPNLNFINFFGDKIVHLVHTAVDGDLIADAPDEIKESFIRREGDGAGDGNIFGSNSRDDDGNYVSADPMLVMTVAHGRWTGEDELTATYDPATGLTTVTWTPNESTLQWEGLIPGNISRFSPFYLDEDAATNYYEPEDETKDQRKWAANEFAGMFLRPDSGMWIDNDPYYEPESWQQFQILSHTAFVTSDGTNGGCTFVLHGDATALVNMGDRWRINDYRPVSGSSAIDAGAVGFGENPRENRVSRPLLGNAEYVWRDLLELDIADVDGDYVVNDEWIPLDVMGNPRLPLDEFGEPAEDAILDLGAWETDEEGGIARPGRHPIDIVVKNLDGEVIPRHEMDTDGNFLLAYDENHNYTAYYEPGRLVMLVDEHAPPTTALFELEGVDLDGGDMRFAVADDLNVNGYTGNRFSIVGGGTTLQVNIETLMPPWPDLEYDDHPNQIIPKKWDITLCAIDSTGRMYFEDFTIEIYNDIEEYDPTDITPGHLQLFDAENPDAIIYDFTGPNGEEWYVEENYSGEFGGFVIDDPDLDANDWFYGYGAAVGAPFYVAPLPLLPPKSETPSMGVWAFGMADYETINRTSMLVHVMDADFRDRGGKWALPDYLPNVPGNGLYDIDGDGDYDEVDHNYTNHGHYAEEIFINIRDTNDDPEAMFLDDMELDLSNAIYVNENVQGSEIGRLGKLSALDQDFLLADAEHPWLSDSPRGTHEFQIKIGDGIYSDNDGTFQIVEENGEYFVQVLDNVTFNYEEQDTFIVWIHIIDKQIQVDEYSDDTINYADAPLVVRVRDRNDAPTLIPGNPTVGTISEDISDFDNIGKSVSQLVAGTVEDEDTFAAQGIAIFDVVTPVGAGIGTGEWQYSLDNGASWEAMPETLDDAAALLLRGEDRIRWYPYPVTDDTPDGDNGIDAGIATFSYYAWDQTDTREAGELADLSAIDSRGSGKAYSIDSDISYVTVQDVNDAPTLDNSDDFTFADVEEDDTDNQGDTIADLIASVGGDPIQDVDFDPLEGIAITGINEDPDGDGAANGIWEFTTDDGATWYQLNTLTLGLDNALLLAADDPKTRIRFAPAVGYTGDNAATLSFRAWDQSQGENGQFADISLVGEAGSSPFSPASTEGTATVKVVEKNRPPDLDPDGDMTLTPIDEDVDNALNDGTTIFDLIASAGGDRITDTNTFPAPLEGIAVLSVDDTNGTWQYTLDGGASWLDIQNDALSGDLGLLLRAESAAGTEDTLTRVRFVPDANWNSNRGSDPALTFRAWDQTGDTEGQNGAIVDTVAGWDERTPFSDETESASITVNPIADAPTAVVVDGGNVVSIHEHNSTGLGTATGVQNGDAIGTLNAIDGDIGEPGESFTFEMLDGASGRFGIGGSGMDQIVVTNQDLVDRESDESYEVVVQATDATGLSGASTVVVTLAPLSEFAPDSVTLTNDEVLEGQTGATLGTLLVEDRDVADTHTLTIVGDPTGSFEIDATTNELKLKDDAALDYEAGATVDVVVRASDGAGISTDTVLTIKVLEVAESTDEGDDLTDVVVVPNEDDIVTGIEEDGTDTTTGGGTAIAVGGVPGDAFPSLVEPDIFDFLGYTLTSIEPDDGYDFDTADDLLRDAFAGVTDGAFTTVFQSVVEEVGESVELVQSGQTQLGNLSGLPPVGQTVLGSYAEPVSRGMVSVRAATRALYTAAVGLFGDDGGLLEDVEARSIEDELNVLRRANDDLAASIKVLEIAIEAAEQELGEGDEVDVEALREAVQDAAGAEAGEAGEGGEPAPDEAEADGEEGADDADDAEAPADESDEAAVEQKAAAV